MKGKYYVYGFIRKDNNSYFYIGKGCRRRWQEIRRRTDEFKEIFNKYDCCVEIIKDGLDEQEALELEMDIIDDLIFNEGYSINIRNFCDKNEECHLTNQGLGGPGSFGHKISEDERQVMRFNRVGEKNNFYGKHHTEETKNKISSIRKNRGVAKGSKNPNYGKKGDKSPIKGRVHTQDELIKMSENNKFSKRVYCQELDITFSSMSDAEKFMKKNFSLYVPGFNRRTLSNKLVKSQIVAYGEIDIDGELTTLHWKFI